MYRSSVADWTFQNDFRAVMEDYDAIYGDLDRIVASESGSFGTLSGSGAAYCVLGSGAPLVERLKDKIIGIGNDFTLHEIKCLHRGDSGGTVSL